MSHELHGLTISVKLRVSAELLPDRNRPRQPPWSRSLFLAKNGENCRRYARPTARPEQAEVSHRVPITLRNVFRPTVDELLNRAPHCDPSLQALIFVPERHKSILDPTNTPLGDGRAPDIASTVPQKMFLSLEGSHMGYPLASLLKLKETLKIIANYFRFELAGRRRLSENRND
jgi:hypothetical protein